MNEEFDNIPSRRLRRLADEYRAMKARIADMTLECEKIHFEVIRILGIGQYESCTVYEVGPTKVRGYTRQGYKAIRARAKVARAA